MQEVTVTIDKKSGKMKVECAGFIGESCDEIKNVENMLGMVTKSEDTADRYLYEIPDPALITV